MWLRKKSSNEVMRYLTFALLLSIQLASAQTPTMIQVKTLDRTFTAVPQLGVSIDGQPFFFTTETGSVYTEISSANLPPKTILLNDDQLEAESWNYSKGILEIIVRKKSYQIIKAIVKDTREKPLSGVKVFYNSTKPDEETTDASGMIQMAMPLDENLNRANLLSVEGHKILSTRFLGLNVTIVVEPVSSKTNTLIPDVPDLLKTYSIDDLDSIKSLTMFYAVFKNLELQKLSEDQRKQIDQKFLELVNQREDSVTHRLQQTLFGTVSNSSLVKEDIELLTNQALAERSFLVEMQQKFNENIETIENKLLSGGGNLSESERSSLLLDLENLNNILESTEQQFYQNQAAYLAAFSSIKNRLLNIEDLENQLSASETLRRTESQALQRKLLITFFTIVGLMVVAFVLFYLTQKFIKQKNALAKANDEVKRVNENLEYLVAQRTKLLEEANKELDMFFYRSSHDLKRPLTTIMGLANIAKHTLEPSALTLFDKAATTAREMDRLLQKLKMISVINHPTDKAVIDFHNQIQGAVDELRGFVDFKDANFKYTIEPGIFLNSFPYVLAIILKNLIENALFFSTLRNDANAKVEMNVFQKDSRVFIVFNDNGVGIPQDIQPKIWDMFFVGNESSKGNGLGLYITQKAIKTLNGEVYFRSIENEFTEFTISIPIQQG